MKNKIPCYDIFSQKNAIIAQNFNDNGDTMSQSLLDLLKAHNPELFDKEGNFKFADFRTALAEADSTFSQETYRLDWRGKSYAKALVYDENRTLLSANHSHNANNLDSQNVLIQGDNLAVLKHLREAYRKQIKVIYIDPPYNTGSDGFVYQDDRKYTPEQIAQITGESEEYAEYIHSFINSKASSHSAWLTFMYPRLKLARELLKDDGVIFISIDDNEQAQLKLLCDEIFGEGNFEGHIHWRRRHNQPNDKTKMIGLVAEHILCYTKDKQSYKDEGVGKLPLTGQFSNPDNDPRGDWATKPWKTGSDQSGARYIITTPTGKQFDEEWMGEYETFKKLLDDNRIVFTNNGNGLPRKKYFKSEREEEGQCATNWWEHAIFGHNQLGSQELTNLFNRKNVFSNPKNTLLIKAILSIANAKNGDFILDFFAGSGTTAHAVMQLNAENKNLNLNYICIQLPENLDEALITATKEAKKTIQNAIDWLDENGKPHNIFEITKARIQQSIEKIKAENPDFNGDLGFKEYKIVPTPDNFGTLADNPAHGLQLLENLQLSDTDCQNILTTWCVQDGMLLHHTPKQVDLGGYIAYRYDTVLYLLNKGFDTKHLAVILRRLDDTTDEFNIDKIVILEPHFDSKAKRELTEAIGQYKPRKGNKLYLVVRNRADKG